MFFGIAKITFSPDSSAPRSGLEKSASALCQKLKSKLKVCAKTCAPSNGVPAIAVTSLARNEEDMDQLLDKVLEICDGGGLGRIDSEFSIVEHIDMLEEDDDDDDDDE